MSPVVRHAAAAAPAAPALSAAARLRPAVAAPAAARRRRRHVRGAKKIVRRDLPAFSRQLAAMLAAGMPIVSALETLEEQASNVNFHTVLTDIRRSIEGGAAFSEALEQVPDVFDALYINMVRSGERSGQFAETMKRIGDLLEANARLRRKVKSAMTYPVVVLTLAIGIAIAMIIFIVPVFAQMYADSGRQLPGPTQFLVSLSKAGKKYAPIIVPAIAAAVYAFRRWKKTEHGAFVVDGFSLRAPVVGVLIQKVSVARFARTMAQLIHSGVPILGALEIVAKASGNRVIGAAILEARTAVERGDTISNGLAGKACLPPILVRMIAAGEKTGKLDEMMESIANTFDDEVEAMLASLTSLIEPLLMVFLGVVIGGIVVCMFLPIFKMSEAISFR